MKTVRMLFTALAVLSALVVVAPFSAPARASAVQLVGPSASPGRKPSFIVKRLTSQLATRTQALWITARFASTCW